MTERLRDLWCEVSRGEKVLAAGLALLVSGFSLVAAGSVLELAGGPFVAGPALLLVGGSLVLAGGLTITAAGVVNERDERRLRRQRLEDEREQTMRSGTRPSWTQVGALEFVRYGRAVGGGQWELERVIFEDTPGGRLAAKRFQMEQNVTGPKVLHTRDTGRR